MHLGLKKQEEISVRTRCNSERNLLWISTLVSTAYSLKRWPTLILSTRRDQRLRNTQRILFQLWEAGTYISPKLLIVHSTQSWEMYVVLLLTFTTNSSYGTCNFLFTSESIIAMSLNGRMCQIILLSKSRRYNESGCCTRLRWWKMHSATIGQHSRAATMCQHDKSLGHDLSDVQSAGDRPPWVADFHPLHTQLNCYDTSSPLYSRLNRCFT
jgi:hypothetical protein